MLLPFHYAIRNLGRDPARFLQTIGGAALVVLLVMGAHSVNEGMRRALRDAGSPYNVMLLGTGSENSVQRSELSERAAGVAETTLAGLHQELGVRAVSPEVVHMGYLTTENQQRVRGLLRGVTPRVLLTHPGVSLLEGRFPGPGELLAGRMAWKTFGLPQQDLAVGKILHMDGMPLRVSGIFADPGSVKESEIWMDLQQLRTLALRDSLSTLVLRLEDTDPGDVALFAKQRLDLQISAVPEITYYQNLAAFHAPVRGMVWITAILIALSAVFGGLNTLYAAFSSRVRELATLQAMGYRPLAVLVSLVQESLISGLLGTILGALAAVLLLSGRVINLSVGAFALEVGPETLRIGLWAGLALGLLGALPPAFRCLRSPLPRALRDSA